MKFAAQFFVLDADRELPIADCEAVAKVSYKHDKLPFSSAAEINGAHRSATKSKN